MAPARITPAPVSSDETVTFADAPSSAQAVLDRIQNVLAAPFVSAEELDACVEQASLFAGSLKKNQPDAAVVRPLLEAALNIWTSPAFAGRVVPQALRASFGSRREAGWPGILSAMLLTPAWQWDSAPTLDQVPDWMWPEYTAWLFVPPLRFLHAGEAEAYAAHFLRHAEPLARWTTRNYGSAAVRGAVTSYLNLSSFSPLYLSSSDLSRHSYYHAQIITRVFTLPNAAPIPTPRLGRALRIGIVLDEADLDGATASGPALFRHLDPLRFETSIFISSATSVHCEAFPTATILPESLAEQLALLNSQMLDVLVFASDIAGSRTPIAQLACQRVAPLQIASSASQITTGYSSIDLFLTGINTINSPVDANENFVERVAVLPAAVRTYVSRELPAVEGAEGFRAAFNISDTSMVVAAFLRIGQLNGAMLDGWAKLLREQANTHLLVQVIADPISASNEAEVLRNALVTRLGAEVLNRITVLDQMVTDEADLVRTLAAADLFLEPLTGGNPDLVLLPLAAGVPVIAQEGGVLRSRFTAAILRSLEMPELVAVNADAVSSIVLKLSSDTALRASYREKLQLQMQRAPIFLDPLAASESFGAIAEHAFDRLLELGRDNFRRENGPLIPLVSDSEFATSFEEARSLFESGMIEDAAQCLQIVLSLRPADNAARHLYARVLAARGQHERALTYLLVVVAHSENEQAVWKDLATTLWTLGKNAEALQAIETCVRMNQTEIEPWLLLGEWAHRLGHQDVVGDIRTLLIELAPNDPRVEAFVASIS